MNWFWKLFGWHCWEGMAADNLTGEDREATVIIWWKGHPALVQMLINVACERKAEEPDDADWCKG